MEEEGEKEEEEEEAAAEEEEEEEDPAAKEEAQEEDASNVQVTFTGSISTLTLQSSWVSTRCSSLTLLL